MDSSKRDLVIMATIMVIALSVGYFVAWDTHDSSKLLTWFWIGIAITIVYLLYRITTNVEKLRAE